MNSRYGSDGVQSGTLTNVDLLENPQLAEGDQILAVPTLVRQLPPPVRKTVADLSATGKVLVGPDIKPRP